MGPFSQKLKLYRKESKLSQKVLAERLGLGQTTVANYENGLRYPSIDILRKISKVLNVSLDDLLGVEEKRTEVVDFDLLGKEFIDLILDHKDDQAIKLVINLAEQGQDVIDLYHYFLKRTLYYVGQEWMQGNISISTEHHISNLVDQLISQLSSYIDPREKNGKLAVFITPSQESHLLGLKIVKETFKKYGWQTIFIGNTVPWRDLLDLIKSRQVDLVCISMTMLSNMNNTQALMMFLREHTDLKIMLGGQAFLLDELAIDFLKPDYHTNSKEELIDLLEKI
jgi:methanogenic corrinoid protein MtbC1